MFFVMMNRNEISNWVKDNKASPAQRHYFASALYRIYATASLWPDEVKCDSCEILCGECGEERSEGWMLIATWHVPGGTFRMEVCPLGLMAWEVEEAGPKFVAVRNALSALSQHGLDGEVV